MVLDSLKRRILKWARLKSPWVAHVNAGSCNGCDIEILAALTPRYDVERFGIILKGPTRHADVLLITGTMTLQARERVKRIYEQMAEPRFVIAVGTCPASGSVFYDSYCHMNGIDADIPVDVYITGCPPKPEAIIFAVVKLLEKLSDPELIKKERDEVKQILMREIEQRYPEKEVFVVT